MLDRAREIHFALVLSCLGKIVRTLHSQPLVGAAAESLFKAQRHLRFVALFTAEQTKV